MTSLCIDCIIGFYSNFTIFAFLFIPSAFYNHLFSLSLSSLTNTETETQTHSQKYSHFLSISLPYTLSFYFLHKICLPYTYFCNSFFFIIKYTFYLSLQQNLSLSHLHLSSIFWTLFLSLFLSHLNNSHAFWWRESSLNLCSCFDTAMALL